MVSYNSEGAFFRMELRIALCFILNLMITISRGETNVEINPDASQSRNERATNTSDLANKVKDLPNVDRDGDTYVLRITTILAEPYTMKQDGKFVGFLPDLIEELFSRADPHRNINYSFYVVPDGQYGSKRQDGSWTGMVGEVVKNINGSTAEGAHLAAAPLKATSGRLKVVDFLQPFAHNKLTFVVQKPHMAGKAPNGSIKDLEDTFNFNFNIFKPLEAAVWILVTILLVIVWLFTWLMNHFNPYEFGERFKRNLATEDEAQYFNITGSLWYAFTILQWQGYDRAPRSIASKVIGCFWMIFVTVTLVTYSGSLFNMLFWASNVHGTRDPLVPPVRHLRDLINHKDGYTYGMVISGSTYHYITTQARGEEAKMIRNYIQSEDGKKNLVRTNQEGLAKVRNEKYAFLVESLLAEYECTQRPCDLMMTGIDMKMSTFGFILPKNAPYGPELHHALLEMIEDGELDAIKERWYNNHQCWNVTTAEEAASDARSILYMNKAKRVNINMFWSPLVIMVIGIVLAIVAAIAEILWYKYRGRYDDKNRQRGQQLTNEDDGHI